MKNENHFFIPLITNKQTKNNENTTKSTMGRTIIIPNNYCYSPNPKGWPPMRTIFQSSPEALVKRTLLGNLRKREKDALTHKIKKSPDNNYLLLLHVISFFSDTLLPWHLPSSSLLIHNERNIPFNKGKWKEPNVSRIVAWCSRLFHPGNFKAQRSPHHIIITAQYHHPHSELWVDLIQRNHSS